MVLIYGAAIGYGPISSIGFFCFIIRPLNVPSYLLQTSVEETSIGLLGQIRHTKNESS